MGIPCTPLHLCLLLTLQLVLVELEAAQLGLHFFPYINLLQSLPLNFVHLDLIFELLYCLEHFQFFTLNLIQLFLNKQPLESHVYLLVDEHVPGGGGEVVVEVVEELIVLDLGLEGLPLQIDSLFFDVADK